MNREQRGNGATSGGLHAQEDAGRPAAGRLRDRPGVERQLTPIPLFAGDGDLAIGLVVHHDPAASLLECQIDDPFDERAVGKRAGDRRLAAARSASRRGPRSAEHVVPVGIRNLDEREKDQIRASGVHVFTMKDVDRDGIARVAERALALASNGTGGIHVSFDLDACDPLVAPGVGTPVKGGFNYREAHMVMELVADSRRLVALDLVEINPTLDIRNATAELATELALSALGKNIL